MVTTTRIFSVFLFVPLSIFIPSDACAPTSAVSDPVTSTTEASTTESTTTEADTTTMMDTSTDSSSTTEVSTTTAMEETPCAQTDVTLGTEPEVQSLNYNSMTTNGVTTASMTVTCSSTDPADYVRMHFDPTQTPHENSNNGGFPSSVTVELTCSSYTNTWTYLKIDVGVLTVDGVTCTQTPR
ncbi:unnamed protein product [Caenorhabditis nigoni]